MRKLFKSSLALMLLFVSTAGIQTAKAQDFVSILTCPFGCGVMEGNTIFGNVLARSGSNLFISAQETPGYMYNVRVMASDTRRHKHTVFGTEDTIIQLALHGGSEDVKEYLPTLLTSSLNCCTVKHIGLRANSSSQPTRKSKRLRT